MSKDLKKIFSIQENHNQKRDKKSPQPLMKLDSTIDPASNYVQVNTTEDDLHSN
jgi:hypothetical protein